MEKSIYYNEILTIESSNHTLELFYDVNSDDIQLAIDNHMDLKSLEKFSKDLLKFVNDVKKDQIKNK